MMSALGSFATYLHLGLPLETLGDINHLHEASALFHVPSSQRSFVTGRWALKISFLDSLVKELSHATLIWAFWGNSIHSLPNYLAEKTLCIPPSLPLPSLFSAMSGLVFGLTHLWILGQSFVSFSLPSFSSTNFTVWSDTKNGIRKCNWYKFSSRNTLHNWYTNSAHYTVGRQRMEMPNDNFIIIFQ